METTGVLLGKGNIVAARGPYRSAVASLTKADAFARAARRGHNVKLRRSGAVAFEYDLATIAKWLENFLPKWKRGRLLTIDYGARDSDLYHRQPHGSLRAYFHQQAITGPEGWSRPGRQDITADINFSDLTRWAEPAAEKVVLRTQAEFLEDFIDPGNPADRFATESPGAGESFLCLDQRRRSHP